MLPEILKETSGDAIALIADRIEELPKTDKRNLIAIAGPPASGKSTFAQTLLETLRNRQANVGLVAMDAFHLDNAVLKDRGLDHRKGAPETFDLAGFHSILQRLSEPNEVMVSTFDRARDLVIGASSVISAEMDTIVVEGNYLLLDEPGWRQLRDMWTLSVQLDLPETLLEKRLLTRWVDLGFEYPDAVTKAHNNDLPNGRRVIENSLAPDFILEVAESEIQPTI